jgi:hypothetical protein
MRRRVAENPFYVLGVPPDASRAQIEAEGQKLLAMLELGLAGAARYPTPVGERPRAAEDVRRALAELRDPARRLEHELVARLPPRAASPPPERATGLAGLRARLGLGR